MGYSPDCLTLNIKHACKIHIKITRQTEESDLQYQWLNRLEQKHHQSFYALYTKEWWTQNRTYEDAISMLNHCDLIIACCDMQYRVIGFARVLTDYVFKALIFDVIVDERARGQGLGQEIVTRIINHPDLQKVQSFELYCPERLIPFYEKQGFVKGSSCLMFHQR
jgi:predicted GNAT family N-acyltransferase